MLVYGGERCCDPFVFRRTGPWYSGSNVKLMKGIIAVFILLIAAVAGAADKFDAYCANPAILQNRAVQNEVKITAQQRAQMNKFADVNRSELEAYQKRLAGKPPEATVIKGYMDELKNKIVGLLSASQLKRLRELNLQALGLAGLVDPMIATKVGLTGSSYTAYKNTFLSGRQETNVLIHQTMDPINAKYEKLAEPYRGKEKEHEAELKKLFEQFKAEATAAEHRLEPKVQAKTKSIQAKLLGLLTAKQKATWEALKGKTFAPPKGK